MRITKGVREGIIRFVKADSEINGRNQTRDTKEEKKIIGKEVRKRTVKSI